MKEGEAVPGKRPLSVIDRQWHNCARILRMSTQEVPIVSFLKEVMRRRKRSPSQLVADLGVSHATIICWLSGEDAPNTKSCRRLAEYTGVSLEEVLSIVGHLPRIAEKGAPEGSYLPQPGFHHLANSKYPAEFIYSNLHIQSNIIHSVWKSGVKKLLFLGSSCIYPNGDIIFDESKPDGTP